MRAKGSVGLLLVVAVVGCNRSVPAPSPPPENTETVEAATPVTVPVGAVETIQQATGALPDLRVVDVDVEPEPQVMGESAVLLRGVAYSFRVLVANLGQAPVAGATVVSFAYGCQGSGLGGTGSTAWVANDMAPGAQELSGPFAFSMPTDRPAGTCSFEFKVDPDNITAESDESDGSNVRRTTVTIG